MSEQDWYGPFARMTRDHLQVVVMGIAGVAIVIAGIIGYDLGGRYTTGKGWTGQVQWPEISVGAFALISAFFAFQRIRKRRSRFAANEKAT
jgi:hypothetical protein